MFCGIDWSDDHHDVAVVDDNGAVIAQLRIGNDAEGLGQLLETLAELGSGSAREVPVAIETAKGLLVASLIAGGWTVFPINPLATSRYRDRHRSGRGKSDTSDALVLANILRTDMHAHRPLPVDSELVRGPRVLTRAQQDAVGDRMRMTNRIRAILKQFFPAAIDAFEFAKGRTLGIEADVGYEAWEFVTADAELRVICLPGGRLATGASAHSGTSVSIRQSLSRLG